MIIHCLILMDRIKLNEFTDISKIYSFSRSRPQIAQYERKRSTKLPKDIYIYITLGGSVVSYKLKLQMLKIRWDDDGVSFKYISEHVPHTSENALTIRIPGKPSFACAKSAN